MAPVPVPEAPSGGGPGSGLEGYYDERLGGDDWLAKDGAWAGAPAGRPRLSRWKCSEAPLRGSPGA